MLCGADGRSMQLQCVSMLSTAVQQTPVSCVCDWVSGEEVLANNGFDTFVYSDPAAAFSLPKPLVYYELKV